MFDYYHDNCHTLAGLARRHGLMLKQLSFQFWWLNCFFLILFSGILLKIMPKDLMLVKKWVLKLFSRFFC